MTDSRYDSSPDVSDAVGAGSTASGGSPVAEDTAGSLPPLSIAAGDLVETILTFPGLPAGTYVYIDKVEGPLVYGRMEDSGAAVLVPLGLCVPATPWPIRAHPPGPAMYLALREWAGDVAPKHRRSAFRALMSEAPLVDGYCRGQRLFDAAVTDGWTLELAEEMLTFKAACIDTLEAPFDLFKEAEEQDRDRKANSYGMGG